MAAAAQLRQAPHADAEAEAEDVHMLGTTPPDSSMLRAPAAAAAASSDGASTSQVSRYAHSHSLYTQHQHFLNTPPEAMHFMLDAPPHPNLHEQDASVQKRLRPLLFGISGQSEGS